MQIRSNLPGGILCGNSRNSTRVTLVEHEVKQVFVWENKLNWISSGKVRNSYAEHAVNGYSWVINSLWMLLEMEVKKEEYKIYFILIGLHLYS